MEDTGTSQKSTTPDSESKIEKLLLVILFLAIVALLGFLVSVIFFG